MDNISETKSMIIRSRYDAALMTSHILSSLIIINME